MQKEIQSDCRPAKDALAKNRRFAKLNKLMEDDEYFEEEMVKMRQPLLYHMYVGRYSNRNSGMRADAFGSKDLSKFLMSRMDKQSYELQLKEAYEDHLIKHGQSYFQGQMDEAMDTDKNGDDLTITALELEDNEDELIRLMHKKFLDGEDFKWVDYEQIDNDETLDDVKQMEQDSEDKYFDAEDTTADNLKEEKKEDSKKESVYTGVLDY